MAVPNNEKTREFIKLGNFFGSLAEMDPRTQTPGKQLDQITDQETEKANVAELWQWTNQKVEKLIKKDPQMALKVAEEYIDADSNGNPIFQAWMVGCGLNILSFPEMKPLLTARVTSPEGGILLDNISRSADFDTAQYTDADIWNHPEFFNRMAAVATLLNLDLAPPGTPARQLYEKATGIKNDPAFKRQAIEIGYRDSPDCRPLIRGIYSDESEKTFARFEK